MKLRNEEILEFGEKHPDAEFRKSVGAVIYDPKQDKVIGLDWGIYPVYGLVQGGVDEGEAELEALKREITEETGYTEFEIKDKLGPDIISYFYADNKNTWRKLQLSCYLAILRGDDQIDTKLEEHESFEVKWINIDDFINMVENHTPNKSQDFRGIGEFLRRAKELI